MPVSKGRWRPQSKEYCDLKRLLNLGAFAVGLLILGLTIQQPGSWLLAVIDLAAIEGVSRFLLRSSLDRRLDERDPAVRAELLEDPRDVSVESEVEGAATPV